MRVRSLALTTELALANTRGTVTDHGDYLVVETPDDPGYYYGNLLVFPAAPQVGEVAYWTRRFHEHLPDLQHVTFSWDGVTGDVGASNNYSSYGQVFCPALGGNYASSGNAYFDSFSNFHLSVSVGVTYQLVCDNLSSATLSGSCPIYDYLGNQVGSAFVSFL